MKNLAELVEELDIALEDEYIYNVDYVELKNQLGYNIEKDFRELIKSFIKDGLDKLINSDDWDVICYGTPWFLQAVKSYSKKLNKIKNAPKDFLELVNIYLPIQLKMEELKPLIIKGRKPAQNPKIVKINENKIVLTCPCCGRKIAVNKQGKIVLHGYRRYGYGALQGSCLGVNFPPLEISTEGVEYTIKYYNKIIVSLKQALDTTEKKLDKMRIQSDIKHIVYLLKTYNKTLEDWKQDDKAIELLKKRG